MKRSGIINAELSAALVGLRHTQVFAVTDSGFPVPAEVQVIDLSLTYGTPRFADVLNAVLAEVTVESAWYAEEVDGPNPDQGTRIRGALPQATSLSHAELKAKAKDARFVVRSGEATPYSNVVMTAGWPFDD